jgi:methyl-accepting chemotaxis protein
MLVACGLSVRLQRGISRPILALTHASERIAVAADYSIRAELSAGAELRTLQAAFNRMLDHIQHSDEALQLAHSELPPRFTFEVISNVFTPMEERLSVTDRSIASMAVKIPTNDVMPIATISAVNTDLSMFAWIERRPSFMFSIRFMDFL